MEKFNSNLPKEKYWMRRAIDRGGQELLYSPKEFLIKFSEYVVFTENNPIIKYVLGNKNEVVGIEQPRPFQIKGFCLFAGISQSTFYKYSNSPEFYEVCEIIKDAVYVQKFEYAAVGMFNASLMTKDLGLVDVSVNIIDDRRKSVDELFPPTNDIMDLAIEGGDVAYVKDLNFENSVSNGEKDKQEFRVSGSNPAGQEISRGNIGGL